MQPRDGLTELRGPDRDDLNRRGVAAPEDIMKVLS